MKDLSQQREQDSMPKVSVIIPTCDRAEYLRVAIASVLNQTFQDFELIVVDDASTNNPSELVESFHDDRIKFFRHEARKGGSAARNTGIVNSKCDYIAFLDDDDEWFPDKLARQMALLLASPPEVGCIYTGYVTVDRSTGETRGQKIPQKRGDLSSDLLSENCLGGTSSVLLKRDCFDKVGLFDEKLPSFQDYDLWIRISRKFHFDYIREPLLRYYLHQQKIWRNLEALNQGMCIMFRKYGDYRTFRKYLSFQYLDLGVSYCYKGKTNAARKSYLQGIRLYPYEISHYFNLCLSLLGPTGFVKIKESKTRLFAILSQKSSTS
jgi:glycosyltransferase involved in cell wall biosynthesis